MASSLNKVQLIGKLGKDPVIRTTQAGGKIGNFSVATSESWKDKNTGERKEVTEWTNIVVFNTHLVEVVEKYLKKGQDVYVEGSLKTRKWQDNAGVDHYTTEVVLAQYKGDIKMLGSKKQDNSAPADDGSQAPETNSGASFADDLDDEIPF